MKSKILKLSTMVLLFTFISAGCQKDNVPQAPLDGKWILIGFGDDSTNELISEPESEPKSSYVIFDKGEMVSFSVSNTIENMKYILKRGNKISFTTHGMETLVGGDTEWGQNFLTLIIKIFEFERNEDILKLYYGDQKFMEFMKFNKEIK